VICLTLTEGTFLKNSQIETVLYSEFVDLALALSVGESKLTQQICLIEPQKGVSEGVLPQASHVSSPHSPEGRPTGLHWVCLSERPCLPRPLGVETSSVIAETSNHLLDSKGSVTNAEILPAWPQLEGADKTDTGQVGRAACYALARPAKASRSLGWPASASGPAAPLLMA
jgi:hypothetical protein